MNIKTKYNIGDTAYYYGGFPIGSVKCEIVEIHIDSTGLFYKDEKDNLFSECDLQDSEKLAKSIYNERKIKRLKERVAILEKQIKELENDNK